METATLPPLVVNQREAGRLLGLSEKSVYRMVKAGELRPVHLGENSVRFDVADLRALIARKKSE